MFSSFFADSQSKNVNKSGTTSGTIFCSSRHQQTLAIQYVSNISEMFKTRLQKCIRFCDNNNNQRNDIGIFAFNKHEIVSSENVLIVLLWRHRNISINKILYYNIFGQL